MNLEEKRSIEEDYQMWLSIFRKKNADKNDLGICIYGESLELVAGTMMLLDEISKNLGISLDNLCEVLRFLKRMEKKI